MALTRESILGASDLKRITVPVPEWGGEVFVRAMTGAERDEWEYGLIVDPAADELERRHDNLRARLLVRTLCDESGERLFSDGDIEQLGAKSASAIARCYDVAARLNGLTAEHVDELVKNSPAGPSAGSG